MRVQAWWRGVDERRHLVQNKIEVRGLRLGLGSGPGSGSGQADRGMEVWGYEGVGHGRNIYISTI